MQVAFYLAGEITQVLDALPWVRCASGIVFLIGLVYVDIDIDIFQICRYIDYRYKHSIFHEQIGRKKQQNRLKTGKMIGFCTIF